MKTFPSRVARAVQWTLALAGAWALGYCAAVFIGAKIYQAAAAREFSRALQTQAAKAARSTREVRALSLAEGSAIGRLAIPRLGLSMMVVEGAGERDLELAVGHIPGTSLPGEAGNAGIAGHRDTFFRPLRFIRKNDDISVTTSSGEYRYRVVSTEIVKPDDVRVLYPSKTEMLTLVTCYPFNFVGPAPRRFIIRAERLGSSSEGPEVMRRRLSEKID
jgi:sortase A